MNSQPQDYDPDWEEPKVQASIYLVIFVVLKITTIIIMMLFGMRSHYLRSKRVNTVFKLFMYYLFLMALVLLYEFYQPKLPLLYVTFVLSSLGQVAQVDMLLRKARPFQKQSTFRRMEMISVSLVVIHCVLLALTFFDDFGAKCQLSRKYPICFFIAMYVQVAFYVLTYYYKCCDYWLDETLVYEGCQIIVIKDQQEQLIETGMSDGQLKPAKNSKRQYSDAEILRAQMWRWQLLATMGFVFAVAIVVLAHTLNTDVFDMLTCDPDDYEQWYPLRFMGQFFSTMHVLVIVAACLQAERAFYTIPHKMGYFDRIEQEEKRMASDATSRRTQSKKVWVLPPGN